MVMTGCFRQKLVLVDKLFSIIPSPLFFESAMQPAQVLTKGQGRV
jgi:hypothetical protein